MQKVKASIRNVVCGKGVKIFEPCNLYEFSIADDGCRAVS